MGLLTEMEVRKGSWRFALLGLFFLAAFRPGAAAAKVAEGQEAVRFTGTNFITNQPLDLNDHLKKRVILLDFGSIYCSSCMVTVPNLIKLSKEYPEDKLAIYNIYLDIYNPQRVTKFFLGFAKDLQFSLLIDNKLAISREYGVDTLPTTMIIDKNGVIRRIITGYTEADEKEINKLIDDLIREFPASTPAQVKKENELLILSPDSFTKTVQDSVFVVGYVGGEGIKDIRYKLNNLPEKVTRTKDNVFHFQTNLSLAMNLIEVKAQVGEGKVKSESVVLFREPQMGMEIKSDLPEYRFHVDEEKKICGKCHQFSLSAQDRESQQSTQLCLKCHRRLSGQTYVHGPISVGGCLPCHDYTSFPFKYELRSQGTSLCFTCHEAMADRIKKSQLHGPVAAGFCIVCHEPHSSPEKYLLRRKLDKLCISCHQDTLQDYAKSAVHTPVQEGNCTGCHEPHASDFRWFLKREQSKVCSLCHEKGTYMHTHHTGDVPAKEIVPGESTVPLDAEGRTICATCHLVHASDHEKLVRGTKDGYCGTICH
jgi:predicted CXXCH cytochrome family protein